MRVPTKVEWEAFESEQLAMHKICHESGHCIHHDSVKALCRLLVSSRMFMATTQQLQEGGEVVELEELLFFYTVAFREGMALAFKLAQQDSLEKLCQGS